MVPQLPLDVIHLIADQVDDAIPWYLYDRETLAVQLDERQTVGRAMCLVCRDWREIGMGLVWGTVSLDLPDDATLLGHLIVWPRLPPFVREIRVFCRHADFMVAAVSLGVLLSVCETVTDVRFETEGRPLLRQSDVRAQLPSHLPALRRVRIDPEGALSSTHIESIMSAILALPHLDRLYLALRPIDHSPPPSLPSAPTPKPLERLQLGIFAPCPRSEQAWAERILLSFDPTSLHTFFLFIREPTSAPLLSFFRRATKLVTLRFLPSRAGVISLYSRLGTVFPCLRTLQYLEIDDVTGSTILGREEHLLTVLSHLPRHLKAVSLFGDHRNVPHLFSPFLRSRLDSPLDQFALSFEDGNFHDSCVWAKRQSWATREMRWVKTDWREKVFEKRLPRGSLLGM
ncbi:hypothetical protein JCM6882_005321 [Rhodosporidiobolus microsporus]